ncbi:pyridoxamine 5'-phosphate oxidase family protein [Jiulongibacter sp. NS-SX5]|uniref:pyridoxamine 5'-phosphate oxidase family protein n=1 Tax=Jiulongibacter sp. NS-SX5 TaxID=3463854 RepID=UPI004059BF41
MAKIVPEISTELKEFIEKQPVFFTGTAMADGRVNVSPKGRDSLRVLDGETIVWRNLTGSGNETATHLAHLNRITLMWCAFEGKPLILRCYGSAQVLHVRDKDFDHYNAHFEEDPGARQIFIVKVETVQTSCGFAVPFMDFKEERDVLNKWSSGKGQEGIKDYWAEKNQRSIDGVETGIFQ